MSPAPTPTDTNQSIAVFAVDPGLTTGIFAATINPPKQQQTLTNLFTHYTTIHTAEEIHHEDPLIQAPLIANLYQTFLQKSYPIPTFMVFESHLTSPQPRTRTQHQYLPTQIAYATIGYRMGRQREYEAGHWGPTPHQILTSVIWQSPSSAKNFATPPRLKLWSLTQHTKGKPHARDASKHFALAVARHYSPNVRSPRTHVRPPPPNPA
jgi:hypothetical protein